MIKEIKYNGITAVPSDYECKDGDLSGAVNLIPEDGSIKPILPPSIVFKIPKEHKVVFVHQTVNYRHYITLRPSDNSISWLDEKERPNEEGAYVLQEPLKIFGEEDEVYQINAIGNTLMAQTSTGIHYFLWRGEQVNYTYLGTHLPELPISFGLRGQMIKSESFDVIFDNITEPHIYEEFTDENKKKITSQVLAKVNKFIADKSTNAGKFLYPFLVRYAYRLYDQSLTMHSAPVLMVCSSDLAPQVFWKLSSNLGNYTKASMYVLGALHELDYAVIDNSKITELKKWSDIVKSVDVFVSKPIYTYDQNGECTRFAKNDDEGCYSVCLHTNSAVAPLQYPRRYQKHTFSEMEAWTFNPDTLEYSLARLELPKRSEEQVKADIRDCSAFYFLKSFKLEELSTTRTVIPIEKDYLQSLVTREVMSDDYDSHDSIVAKSSFVYNQRLNLTGIKKKLYSTFHMGAMENYSDGNVHHYTDNTSPTVLDRTYTAGVYFFIKQDGKDIIVNGQSYTFGLYTPILFLYYPNPNCYKAVVVYWDGVTTYYEVPMETHGFLNGAFWFGGWNGLQKTVSSGPTATLASENVTEVPNKIYTSDVNNPFRFPVTNINTVGTGHIIGVSTAAKAMSQGQFGQFPLYAFTDEGVWALEVSSSGSYAAKQPITRDVCINPDSITQIDSAVLFVTDRGIMLLSGSNSQCISDDINGDYAFSPLTLPGSAALIQQAGIDDEQVAYIPFLDFLKGCGMLYDYTHQRIIVYNPTRRYAYVYSLKDKAWGMAASSIADGVNSYPDALAMDTENALVNFSVTDDNASLGGIKGMLFTRPIKLDGTDILKTVDTVIQRGYYRNSHIQQVLYGSRDLFNWFIVWSSKDNYLRGFRGTPYKYFRMALICNMTKDEALYGCTVQYTPRLANQPR